jgi:hypothetical protein
MASSDRRKNEKMGTDEAVSGSARVGGEGSHCLMAGESRDLGGWSSSGALGCYGE